METSLKRDGDGVLMSNYEVKFIFKPLHVDYFPAVVSIFEVLKVFWHIFFADVGLSFLLETKICLKLNNIGN